jgi:REP-associated tyrosine transposase
MTTAHIILGGRERPRCFACAQDRLACLDRLVTFGAHHACGVHAYALMANHVHLLATCCGGDTAEEFARAVGAGDGLCRDVEVRPIGPRRYLLGCMRYIELNPVRARMVERPEQYRWSSYRANALGYSDPAITPHPLYFAFGRSPQERRRAYARFVEQNRSGAGSP